MAYTLKERLWYTSDKAAVVPEGDTKASFLLGNAGAIISDGEADRLGLKDEPKKANKARPTPANKSGKRTAKKSK